MDADEAWWHKGCNGVSSLGAAAPRSLHDILMLLLLLLNATQKTSEDVPHGVTGGAVLDETGRLGTACHVERARLRLPCSQPKSGGARGIRISGAVTHTLFLSRAAD